MSLAVAGRAPDIGGPQLRLLKQALLTHAGITVDSTPGVVAGYVRDRMDYLGLCDVDAYLDLLGDSIAARAERVALTDLMTVKETRFFRQPGAFQVLTQYFEKLLDAAQTPAEISFWSAGCATGQELYSMAMVAESVFSQGEPRREWHGIGSDLSYRAIVQAREGVYAERAQESIPARYRARFLDPKLGGRVRVTDAIRHRTHFFHSNLLHVEAAPFASFNAIFCQNVLIYFPREQRGKIIDQLVDRLGPGGLLVLGPGEDVSWQNSQVERLLSPGVCAYRKNGGSGRE